MSTVILAVDCGLANCGWAILEVGRINYRPTALGVFRTKKSDKKRNILAVDDSLRRVRELAAALRGSIDDWYPNVVCCEAMSYPRNASAAAKLGMGYATLATLCEVRGLPLLQSSPQEVRKQLLGSARASSKDDLEEEVRRLLPGADGMLGHVPASLRNHAWDAAAVGLVCLRSDVIRALRGAA